MSYASLLLVTRPDHAHASALAADMAAWLRERGASARVVSHRAAQPTDGDALRAVAAEADAVIVLGGDGTFIGVTRQLIGLGLPFLGINCGRLGFLTEIPVSAWQDALTDMQNGVLRPVPRTILAWNLERGGAIYASGHAINDVFVGRGGLARVVNLHVSVQHGGCVPQGAHAWTDLGWVRADGLITASPLGSSAYSLSARGPLLHPDLSNLLLTAVAPFMGSLPPMVLPGTSCLCIEPEAGIIDGDVCLTVDGQEGFALRGGDVVRVCGVADGLHMLVRQTDTYFQTLRGRGVIHVGTGSGTDSGTGSGTDSGTGSGTGSGTSSGTSSGTDTSCTAGPMPAEGVS